MVQNNWRFVIIKGFNCIVMQMIPPYQSDNNHNLSCTNSYINFRSLTKAEKGSASQGYEQEASCDVVRGR